MCKVMNPGSSPALSSLHLPGSGLGREQVPSGRERRVPCLQTLPPSLAPARVGAGVFPCCGAAFPGGYTLRAQEAHWNSKALPVPWHSLCAAGYRDGSSSPVSAEVRVFSTPGHQGDCGPGLNHSKPPWAAPCAELVAAQAPTATDTSFLLCAQLLGFPLPHTTCRHIP